MKDDDVREVFICGFFDGLLYSIPLWLSWCHPLSLSLIGGGLIVYKFIPKIM